MVLEQVRKKGDFSSHQFYGLKKLLKQCTQSHTCTVFSHKNMSCVILIAIEVLKVKEGINKLWTVNMYIS